MAIAGKKLGLFTRVLDQGTPAERYAMCIEQIIAAERFGYDCAWLAQHHFDPDEGGIPAPFILLAQAATRTSRIRLGTGVITLPLENGLRIAEDASVLDIVSGGRLELGVGTGGTPATFASFGIDMAEKSAVHARQMELLKSALLGTPTAGGRPIYPGPTGLTGRIWQATFSADGGRRAGLAGDGLMLSRSQPRPKGQPDIPLHELQAPIVEAYLAALPRGCQPRIMASRTVFVADERKTALDFAEIGLRKFYKRYTYGGHELRGDSLEDLIASYDTHLGTPDEVIESLSQDPILDMATEVAIQVHSVDPPHAYVLRSLELFADKVAPAMGWTHRAPRVAAVA